MKRQRSKVIAIMVLGACLGSSTLAQAQGSPSVAQPRVSMTPLYDAEVLKRISVYVIGNDERSRNRIIPVDAYRSIEDEFMSALITKGYLLAARSDIGKIVEELKLKQSSDIASDPKFLERLQVLQVAAVAIVNVNEVSFGEGKKSAQQEFAESLFKPKDRRSNEKITILSVEIGVRIIDVEQAQVVLLSQYRGSYRVSNERDQGALREAIKQVAAGAASGIPARSTPRGSVSTPSR